jgi:DNA-binding Lrp family transcriptional regulator
MHESFKLNELDRRIVHALQLEPRAPWSLVSALTGADPTTVMRHWMRLSEAGAAWITCYPPSNPPPVLAIVELNCAHGHSVEVATRLAADKQTVSINIHAGRCDVLMEVVARSHSEISRYVLERLGRVDGIREVRTHLVSAAYREGAEWHLDALDAAAVAQLRAGAVRRRARYTDPHGAIRSRSLTEAQRELAYVLASDPRMSASRLARELGISAVTAQRRLNALLDAQPLLRCEIARTLSESPICATFFLRCPADKIAAIANTLRSLPEVRAVLAITGPYNIYAAAWLRSLNHVHLLESALATKFPHISLMNSSVVIRPVKQVGHLVDEDAWSYCHIPIDYGLLKPTATPSPPPGDSIWAEADQATDLVDR